MLFIPGGAAAAAAVMAVLPLLPTDGGFGRCLRMSGEQQICQR